MKKIINVVNQNIQDTLKKFKDTKNKEYEDTETNKCTQRNPE
jgi:hypothetical protein